MQIAFQSVGNLYSKNIENNSAVIPPINCINTVKVPLPF